MTIDTEPPAWQTPVGTVLPFLGADTADLAAQGWLPCDGSTAIEATYPELAAVLGNAYGNAPVGSFRLPDHRGYFQRGQDAKAGRDPDVATREAQNGGSAVGDAVGSVQGQATGRPNTAFTGFARHLPSGEQTGNSGSLAGRDFASFNPGAVTVAFAGGGDAQTCPVNSYVQFIVKASSFTPSGQPVDVPIGAAIAFSSEAADALASQWLWCNGNDLKNLGVYSELFAAIGTAHGSPGNGEFNLPDYRGVFLRGVDAGAGRDPGANARTVPAPNGNSGDQVGSAQAWATAAPTSPFTAEVPHLPTKEVKIDNLPPKEAARPGGEKTEPMSGQSGGDAETRPLNIAVDWHVRFLAATAATQLPVGSVIALAGGSSPPPRAYWLPCDGSQITAAKDEYPELFAVIEYTYGGSPQQGFFLLPDYRGRFLRGSDHGAGRDPDAGKREAPAPGGADGDRVGTVQAYATGSPNPDNPFVATLPNLPDDSKYIFWSATGHALSNWNSGTAEFPTGSGGGDAESRPVNIYVDYYLKAANGASA